jgi:hypothetical protein
MASGNSFNATNFAANLTGRCKELLRDNANVLKLVSMAHTYLNSIGLDLALLVDFTLWDSKECAKDASL